MKFIESTNFFVRTIMFNFSHPDKKKSLQFKLVPVIHIGTPQYYQMVFQHLNECDEVLFEGVQLKQSKFITMQYQRIARKLGLVTQSESLKLSQLNVKLIHSDFDQELGRMAWEDLKFQEKIKLIFVEPMRIWMASQGLTREILAKHFMTSNEENYLAYGPLRDEKGTLENLFMNVREQIVFKIIRERIAKDSQENKIIGIIYGAGHMNVIARNLIDEHGYVSMGGEFMKAFEV